VVNLICGKESREDDMLKVYCGLALILSTLLGCVGLEQQTDHRKIGQTEPNIKLRPQYSLDEETKSAQFFWNVAESGEVYSVTIYIDQSDVDAIKAVGAKYKAEFKGHKVGFHITSGLLSIGYTGSLGAVNGTASLSPVFKWSNTIVLKPNSTVKVDRLGIELHELQCISPTKVKDSRVPDTSPGLEERFVVRKLLMTVYFPSQDVNP
jgi:hypothetical protein